jgi:thioredoxin reductase (NADPH)
VLAERRHRLQLTHGERLYGQGDRTWDFYVMLTGLAPVVDRCDVENDQIVGIHGAGRFLGELSLLTGETLFITAVVVEPGDASAILLSTLTHLVDQQYGAR